MADNVTMSTQQYDALQKAAPTLGQGLLGGFGGYLSGQNAVGAAQQQAGQQATSAAGAQFRPVGITSRFGQSGYNFDANGNLIGAGYQVAPDIAAMREGAIGQAGGLLGQAGQGAAATAPAFGAAQSMYSLGQGYLAQNPQEQAAQWLKQQQDLLRPSQEQAYSSLQQQLQNTGRGGFSIAQGGSLGAANPEAQAYYNALAQQNARLASEATTQGQAQAKFGADLVGAGTNAITGAYGAQTAGYNPYTAAMGAATGLEGYGAAPMATSAQLGQYGAQAGANAGALANQGYATQAAGNSYSPWGDLFSGAAKSPQAGELAGNVVGKVAGLFGWGS